MKFKLLNAAPQKTYAVILEENDEVMRCLSSFAERENIQAAHFTAIGALHKATIGFFDFAVKDYLKIHVNEQTEVLSMIGDISVYNNKPKLHAHIVLGKRDGTAHGGHLLEAFVHPTLEIIVTISPSYLVRKMDKLSGIPLIDV